MHCAWAALAGVAVQNAKLVASLAARLRKEVTKWIV